jgi:glycosyltransferase involved in cell wall biosynthesis
MMEVFKDKIRYIHKVNGGACSARNEGIRQSCGEFVAFFDCDDLYDPRKVELSVKHLQDNPSVGFVHTAAEFIDADDNVVGGYNHPKSGCLATAQSLLLGNHVCNSTVVVRRDVLTKAGFFDETIFTPGDWDMWIRLSCIAPGGYIAQALTKYRVIDNYIFKRLEQALREELYVIEKSFKATSYNVFFRRRVISNYHFRFSLCYFIKDQRLEYWKNLKSALGFNILNIKAWGVMGASIVAPSQLKSMLYARIVRLKNEGL